MTDKTREGRKVDYLMSQREIAQVLGITETEVKRIESRAIAKLRRTGKLDKYIGACLLYTSPSPRDGLLSRMPSSA